MLADVLHCISYLHQYMRLLVAKLMRSYFQEGWVHKTAWTLARGDIMRLEGWVVNAMYSLAQKSAPPKNDLHVEVYDAAYTGQNPTIMFLGGWCLPTLAFFRMRRVLEPLGYRMVVVQLPSDIVCSDPKVSRQCCEETTAKLAELVEEYDVTHVMGYSLGSAFAVKVASLFPQKISWLWLMQTGESITRGMWESNMATKVTLEAVENGFSQEDFEKAFDDYNPQDAEAITRNTKIFIDIGDNDKCILNPESQLGALLERYDKLNLDYKLIRHPKFGHYAVMDAAHTFAVDRLNEKTTSS